MFVGKHAPTGAPVYIELVSEVRRYTGCDAPLCRRRLDLYGYVSTSLMNKVLCSQKCMLRALQHKYPLAKFRAEDSH